MPRPILLLAPAQPADAPGGAGTYNRRLIQALVQAGHPAALIAPDAIGTVPPDAALVVDGACLSLFAQLPPPVAALIHHPSPFNAPWPAATRAALAWMPRVIATNAPCAERLARDYGITRLTLVPAGQDDVPRHRRAGAGCTILSVGPLVPRRAHDVLLRALARLIDLDWRLILAGDASRDPACAAALTDQARTAGIADRVTLIPAANAESWSATDLLVLAHPVTGMDGAPAEACRRGIPVAICGLADLPEAVTCSPGGDADALSKVIRRLVFDRLLYDRAAEAAWRHGSGLPDWATQAGKVARALAG